MNKKTSIKIRHFVLKAGLPNENFKSAYQKLKKQFKKLNRNEKKEFCFKFGIE